MSFVLTAKAQCWSETDKIYRLFANEAIIVRTDGTMWYLAVVNPTSQYLTQLGTDTDWDKLVEYEFYLKTDGTLWKQYSIYQSIFNPVYPGTNWKDVNEEYGIKTDGTIWDIKLSQEATPTQIGTDTNWTELVDGNMSLAKKADGTLWWIGSSYPITGTWVEFSYRHDGYYPDDIYGIKDDGTLWKWNSDTDLYNNTPTQIGSDTDWVKVGRNNNVALKANGTMWQINAAVATQIGTDTDWESSKEEIARKTDGSYWAKGAFNMLYNTISYVSNPDYSQYRKIIPEGTYINYYLQRQIGQYQPSYNSFSIIALNNNNELFAWGQFGIHIQENPFSITYPNRVQIGCDATLNTNETIQKEISVFPNPVTDILNIQIDDQLNNAEIFDLGGRLLYTEKIINNQLNMSQLQRGIYFVKINGTDKVYSIKVSKE